MYVGPEGLIICIFKTDTIHYCYLGTVITPLDIDLERIIRENILPNTRQDEFYTYVNINYDKR